MPEITLTFSAPLNVSCQVGDTAYYVDTAAEGGFNVNRNNMIEIGTIMEITNPTSNAPVIRCNTDLDGSINGETEYIFFKKNQEVNTGSLTGYYAYSLMMNDSFKDAELFAITADTFVSSK